MNNTTKILVDQLVCVSNSSIATQQFFKDIFFTSLRLWAKPAEA